MMFGWILLLIIIIIAVVYLAQTGFELPNKGAEENDETPLETLKKRFARGEIDKEEYEERKQELEKDK